MTSLPAVAALVFGWLIATGPAVAATISIISMQYSETRPVPHFRYEGETVAGDVDLLADLYASFVHCRTECSPDSGRPTAVVTLNGPGGNYTEGLGLADFFRANNIATVIESGAECFSACAFAFLGGTAYSSNDRIGQYVDRIIEPGGILGFHAPYRDEASITAALLERSAGDLLAESRDALSLMVKELVKWNVDPEIIHYMLGKGPDQLYTILQPDDYYLVRSALPQIPSQAWMTSVPDAIRNACIRLLALFERTDPLELRERITSPFEEGIGVDGSGGSLSGYRLSDRLLDVGHCSATDSSTAEGNNLGIALYMNPGIDGTSQPVLSFYNRDDYFSSAGIGGSPLKRVFQRGGIGHWFLPVGTPVEEMQGAAGLLIQADKFFTIRMPDLPVLPVGFTADVAEARSRVSHSGDIWLFEQVGSADLVDAAAEASVGVALSHDSITESGLLREGSFGDGTFFSVTGFKGADGTGAVQKILLLNGGLPPSEGELATIRGLQCALVRDDESIAC